MIPMSAVTVKHGRELSMGDIGFYMTPEPHPFVTGPIQNGVLCTAIFSPDKVRVVGVESLVSAACVIAGAQIDVDPQSARRASLGAISGCPVFAGPNRFLEAEYDMEVFQIALAAVDEATRGERLAFERWRIVLRHDNSEYEILSRSPATD